MKSIIIIASLFLGTLVQGNIYYVQDKAYNENASDRNPGTDIDHPWATWQRAFNTARAGDTVYFRGGTWYPTSDIYGNVCMHYPANGNGYNGTYTHPVCFFAYPPDVEAGNMPVLDCINTHPSTPNHVGLYIRDSRYVKFRGLKITNVRSWPRHEDEMWCAGIMAHKYEHLTLEHMTASHIGGVGFISMDHDTLYLINCDSHNNCDSLDWEMPGNDGDGYTFWEETPPNDTCQFMYISGCRAWENSDDGFNIVTRKHLVMHDCWAWSNGDFEGDANGFKMSLSHLKSPWKRLIYNCISAGHAEAGFIDLNLDGEIGPHYSYLNNTSYLNRKGFGSGKGRVFDCSRHPAKVIYRNDISFASTGRYPASFKACNFGYPSYVIQDHNTWVQTGQYFHTEANPAYCVSEDDFISLDMTQLGWPRKADGSLPDISFLKLQENSDLINQGVDVGLAYYGEAPDLGAFQSGPFSVELLSPEFFKECRKGNMIIIQARVKGDLKMIQKVLFYTKDGERVLGMGKQLAPDLWQLIWEADKTGYHDLRAVAFSSQNGSATSSIRRIRIR